MSAQEQIKRLTAPDTGARKGGEPIVCLTSYHAHTARLLDRHCDLILVGDSLGMVMHGLETTVPVTLDMMILQGLAVMRGSNRALVVVDMPFGSYEASREQAFMSAARILKETGCGAVKLEGGRRMAETIAFLTERGVPVMAHTGLTPQAINALGSFRAQGGDPADWRRGGAGGSRRGPPRRSSSRPSGSGRVPPATGRSWCSRTCSASRRGCPNSSSATRNSAPRSARRWRIMPARPAPAPFR